MQDSQAPHPDAKQAPAQAAQYDTAQPPVQGSLQAAQHNISQPAMQAPSAVSPQNLSQNASVFAFSTGQPNKVHHTYIWLGSLLGVGAVFIVSIFYNLDSILPLFLTTGANAFIALGLGLLGILVIYGIAVAITALSYKHLSFVFDEKEFSLYSGIFNKQHVHIPYTRVQSVNHRQSLVQRLAGVCTVEIDTAGGASNKAIKVPYVKLNVGEAIRSDLFMRKAYSMGVASEAVPVVAVSGQAAPSANLLDEAAFDLGVDNFRGLYGGNFAGMEPVSFERRLNNKELALASFSHSGIPGLLITALLTVFALLVPIAMFTPQFLPLGFLALPAALLFFAFMAALAALSTALSYGSFSVRRRGNRIEVERGILHRDFSGIDINRVQSVVIRQSFIRRLMGYCEVSLGRVRAGGGENQNTQATLNAGGLVVHPFLKITEVDGLLAGILPEFSDRPASAEFKGLPKVAMRRGLLRNCVWQNGAFFTALLFLIAQIVLNSIAPAIGDPGFVVFLRVANIVCIVVYVFTAVATGFAALGTLWWKRGSGFAMNKRYVAICNDGLSTETTYFPRQKIQNVITRTNPFQRRSHVVSIAATTAAGIGGSGALLWDVTEEDGQAWLNWLKPRTGMVQ